MKNASVLIAAILSFSIHGNAAQLQKPVPRVTGQEFIERYFNSVNVPIWQQNTKMLVERESALGYIAGVADAGQGKTWCDKSKVKTIEIDSELVHAMRKLPPETLEQDAASLITELLKKRFPCT